MEELPPEVVAHIFLWVDRLTWPCCRMVCRRWDEIVVRLAHATRSPQRHHVAPPQYSMMLAREGRLAQLQWARANGCPWDAYTTANAARNGHLEVLRWARANGCEWNRDVCAWAAGGGHLEVLQWARANGCPWDVLTTTYAARAGHLEVLRWARANGCEWSGATFIAAAEGGHAEVLRWLNVTGCPTPIEPAMRAAQEGGHEAAQEVIADMNDFFGNLTKAGKRADMSHAKNRDA